MPNNPKSRLGHANIGLVTQQMSFCGGKWFKVVKKLALTISISSNPGDCSDSHLGTVYNCHKVIFKTSKLAAASSVFVAEKTNPVLLAVCKK